MTEFVLERIMFLHGEGHAVVEGGYVNEALIESHVTPSA